MQPQEIATVETDLFEHREVKPHFINDCCFGEDFVAWLIARVANLSASGFAVGEPIQEDYGWGFWITRGKDRFWIAFSYMGDGPTETPAQWVVSISQRTSLFGRRDASAVELLRTRILDEFESTEGIRII